MPQNDGIRVVHLTVRFGNVPRFELRADERVTSIAGDAKFSRSAAGDEVVELLKQVLNKIRGAYGTGTSISLNVKDGQIEPD